MKGTVLLGILTGIIIGIAVIGTAGVILANSTIELPGMTVWLGEVTHYNVRNVEPSKLSNTDAQEQWILTIDAEHGGKVQHWQVVVRGHQYMAELVSKLDKALKRREIQK